MKNRVIYRPLFIWTSLIFPSFICNAQFTYPADSVIYHSALQNSINLFYENTKLLSRYYNGKEYVGAPYTFSEGSPFFTSGEGDSGSINYDNVFYPGVRLLYDEFLGEVVLLDENHRISLVPEKVKCFSIMNNHFVRIDYTGTPNFALSPGYYQVLYTGKLTVLKKDEKRIRELPVFSGDAKSLVLDTKSNYYIKYKNNFFEINSKKELLKSMKDYQRQIEDFIKKNGIKFKNDIGNDLTEIAAYFEQSSAPE